MLFNAKASQIRLLVEIMSKYWRVEVIS